MGDVDKIRLVALAKSKINPPASALAQAQGSSGTSAQAASAAALCPLAKASGN